MVALLLKNPRIRTLLGILIVAIAVAIGAFHQMGPQLRPGPITLSRMLEVNNWQLALKDWFIEDAAISFAYAKNWAAGDGLVVFPGGERIEGYSNPTWVALIALGYMLGFDGFVTSKFLGILFGSLTIIVSYFLARELMSDRKSGAAFFAPILLALFPQFAFWNTSGLENSLFQLMLALGMWRTLVEARKGGFPLSAIAFLMLSVTRPEAIMYAAWGGFLFMVTQWRAGRGIKPTLLWLATFFVPFLAYHYIRYDYFSWMFPNTYYAKLGERTFRPLHWTGRGWQYLRNWGADTGTGWFLPLVLTGLVGLRRHRGFAIIVGLTTAFTIALLYPSAKITQTWHWWPRDLWSPKGWTEMRAMLMIGTAIAAPLFALGDKRSAGRVMAWGMMCITVFFTVKSSGDWMKGFRWMSFLSVPLVILMATGLDEIGGAFDRLVNRKDWRLVRPLGTVGALASTALAIAVIPGWREHDEWFFRKKETSPQMVKKRADYTRSITEQLFLDEPIVNLDVDMGAHMYWSDHQFVDMAGLVDIPIAMHDYRQHRAFVEEYVYVEMQPHFAHVHGGWASNSRLQTYDQWKDRYIEIPPYAQSSRTGHGGNHIRRDIIMSRSWTATDHAPVMYEGGWTLHGIDMPSPVISQGKALFLRVGLQNHAPEDAQDVRMVGILSNADGALFTFDMAPAYDWFGRKDWRPEEIFTGPFVTTVPPTLEPGTYDVGVALVQENGTVLQPLAETAPEGVQLAGLDDVDVRFAKGELRYVGKLTIGSKGTGETAARDLITEARQLAAAGQCNAAYSSWRRANFHLPKARIWLEEQRESLRDGMSTCYAQRAQNADDHVRSVEDLELARYWNHRNPVVQSIQTEMADALEEKAIEAQLDQDWNEAYTYWRATLRAEPGRSWARKQLEEVRDRKLGLDRQRPSSRRVKTVAKPAAPAALPAGPASTRPMPARPEGERRNPKPQPIAVRKRPGAPAASRQIRRIDPPRQPAVDQRPDPQQAPPEAEEADREKPQPIYRPPRRGDETKPTEIIELPARRHEATP